MNFHSKPFFSKQIASTLPPQAYCDPWKAMIHQLVQNNELPEGELSVDYSFLNAEISATDLSPSNLPTILPRDDNEIDIDA